MNIVIVRNGVNVSVSVNIIFVCKVQCNFYMNLTSELAHRKSIYEASNDNFFYW